MKSVALIPARYASTRFPGKLMQMLGDKTIIRHTYENTIRTHLFDEVIVVTDDERIFDEIVHYGGYAMMSRGDFESGSDRIASIAEGLDTEVIINVQGDEPFVNIPGLKALLSAFNDEKVRVASLMTPISKEEDILNPNYVKVVTAQNGDALYFSRAPIPYKRNTGSAVQYMKHIGIYGYRKEELLKFPHLEKTPLELAEKLEQLRYLENGIPIRMILTDETPLSIDTPEDLEKAKRFYENLNTGA
ncbi:MAG: 3-deoxy-manno-octulosonate cytidylyltransferase [Chitinophagaceae bacterium]|nr:3-deoxy-manno-octulosonate cytidylyltransferase [Chitinophagaceae bacterium]